MNQTEYIIGHIRYYGYMTACLVASIGGVVVAQNGDPYYGLVAFLCGVLLYIVGLSFASKSVNTAVSYVVPGWTDSLGQYDMEDFK